MTEKTPKHGARRRIMAEKTTKPAPKTKPAPLNVRTKADDPIAITPAEYGGLQAAFDYLNARLFEGELPNVFITYQRRGSFGRLFFAGPISPTALATARDHEIALNPDGFVGQTDEFIVSILLHEMTHVWQQAFGKPPSRGYHNKEWATKMEALGLMPSNTGDGRWQAYRSANGALHHFRRRLCAGFCRARRYWLETQSAKYDLLPAGTRRRRAK